MRPLLNKLNHPEWLHGHTAFTTLRTQDGKALLWPQHLQRLKNTCTFLSLPQPQEKLPKLEPLPSGLLRITVTWNGTFYSHKALNLGPKPEQGVTVYLTDMTVHSVLGHHKTGNYLPYRLAQQQAVNHEAFEGWLQNAEGDMVDGSRTSPLFQIGKHLILPTGGLPSVTRAFFIKDRPVARRPVHSNELENVTQAWICGSGLGVVPVAEIKTPTLHSWIRTPWPQTDHPALLWPK